MASLGAIHRHLAHQSVIRVCCEVVHGEGKTARSSRQIETFLHQVNPEDVFTDQEVDAHVTKEVKVPPGHCLGGKVE